jgi:hypothetical protein
MDGVGALINIIDVMCHKHNIENTLNIEILRIAKLIIAQNYFKFREDPYLQKNGLAMRAPTSSILSEIYKYVFVTTDCVLDRLIYHTQSGHRICIKWSHRLW